jgi:hypothetical protein
MWIVAIAWMYVALMMALAEATSTQGSVLGAIIINVKERRTAMDMTSAQTFRYSISDVGCP